MAVKGTLTRNSGQWTEGRYRSFVTSALRGAFRRWPPKFLVLKNAQAGRKINKITGKLAMHYKCAICKKAHVLTQVQVDHIDPVVCTKNGFISWDVFIDRLYCEASNLQIVCKECHKIKCAEEKIERTKKIE